MKVVAPGMLTFSLYGELQWAYWVIDPEGVRYADRQEQDRAALKAALVYIAEVHGIDLADDTDLTRVTPAVERATLDAIAVMRWPARDE